MVHNFANFTTTPTVFSMVGYGAHMGMMRPIGNYFKVGNEVKGKQLMA